MKIHIAPPPNYADIVAAFPWVTGTRGILYAWDGCLFNPDRITVTPSLLAHEIVHSQQIAGDPHGWWSKYLADPQFRFDQERAAHIEEYAYIYAHEAKRAHRRLYLSDIAARLAGPLYGHLTSKADAVRMLKRGAVLPSNQSDGVAA